jgi:2-methylcitrate dehydratase PrpD
MADEENLGMENNQTGATALARAAAATHWSSLPEDVRTATVHLLLDALAVMAGAAHHPSMTSLARQIAPPVGPATFIGEKRGAHVRDAVLLNAATTTVLQRQDGYAHAKGHPASQLVPVLLALAERDSATPDRMLAAMVAGYEVGTRVGMALGGVPPWLHDNGNWATIGTAAGAAHFLSSGDARIIAAAIEGAASLALSFDRFTTAAGATIHHLYPAMATTQALACAEGAAAGMTALPGSLERFYGPRLGTHFDADKLVVGIADDRWSQFEIRNGYFKLHPSCAHLHGVNVAVEQLIADHDFTEGQIERVDIATFGEAMEIDSESPSNDLAARFSARATVAAALRYGHLTDEALLDLDALTPLMNRITVTHDPQLDRHVPEGRPGVVSITLQNGTQLVRRVIHPRGTPRVNATDDERRGKARYLLKQHYDDRQSADIENAVMALGDGGPLSDLTAALRT